MQTELELLKKSLPDALLGAGHRSKEVAGAGGSSDGLNRAKAKSSTAQEPESLVVLSRGSELRGVGGRDETRSRRPSFSHEALKVQLDRRTTGKSRLRCGGA